MTAAPRSRSPAALAPLDLVGWPGMLWLTQNHRNTGCRLTRSPHAGRQRSEPGPWLPRRARSALDLAYCSREPARMFQAPSSPPGPVSPAAAGALRENDATVSRPSPWQDAPLRESRLKSRSRCRPAPKVPDLPPAAPRSRRRTEDNGVIAARAHRRRYRRLQIRRNSQKLIATPSTTSSTNTEHVGNPPRGRPSKTPIAAGRRRPSNCQDIEHHQPWRLSHRIDSTGEIINAVTSGIEPQVPVHGLGFGARRSH